MCTVCNGSKISSLRLTAEFPLRIKDGSPNIVGTQGGNSMITAPTLIFTALVMLVITSIYS